MDSPPSPPFSPSIFFADDAPLVGDASNALVEAVLKEDGRQKFDEDFSFASSSPEISVSFVFSQSPALPLSPPIPVKKTLVDNIETFLALPCNQGPHLKLVSILGFTLVADRDYKKGELVTRFIAKRAWPSNTVFPPPFFDASFTVTCSGWVYEGEPLPGQLYPGQLGGFVNTVNPMNSDDRARANLRLTNKVPITSFSKNTERQSLRNTNAVAPQLFYVAKRDIARGEHLLACYSSQQWLDLKEMGKQMINIGEWTQMYGHELLLQ